MPQPGLINVSKSIWLGFWVLVRILTIASGALAFSTGIIFDSSSIL